MNTPSEPAGWSRAVTRLVICEAIAHGAYPTGEQPGPVIDAFVDRIMALAPPSSLDGGGAGNAVMTDIFEREFDGDDDPRLRVARCITRAEAEAILEHSGDMIAALAAAPLPVGKQGVSPSRDHDLTAGSALEWRPLEYERPKGETFDQMRTEVWKGELYKRGDTILVWVNEGDLYLSKVMVPGGVKLPPTDPTGSEYSQSEEPAGPTVGAKTPSPPLADGEPETP